MEYSKPGRPRHRKPPDKRRDGSARSTEEDGFSEETELRIQRFLQSDDKELVFEPMNSYKRRLVHNIAKPYQLDTESRGEEPERHVCLVKTADSKAPSGVRLPRAWDFGNQTFAVNPGEEGLRIALKEDGSLEIFREGDRKHVVDERLVTTRELKIKGGKIVLPGDPGW